MVAWKRYAHLRGNIKIFENADGSHCLSVFEKDKEQRRGVFLPERARENG